MSTSRCVEMKSDIEELDQENFDCGCQVLRENFKLDASWLGDVGKGEWINSSQMHDFSVFLMYCYSIDTKRRSTHKAMSLRELRYPLGDLRDLCVLNRLASRVRITISDQQVRAMPAFWNHEDGNLGSALQSSTGTGVRRDGCVSPRIPFSVSVDQARCVVDEPAASVGVRLVFGVTL